MMDKYIIPIMLIVTFLGGLLILDKRVEKNSEYERDLEQRVNQLGMIVEKLDSCVRLNTEVLHAGFHRSMGPTGYELFIGSLNDD